MNAWKVPSLLMVAALAACSGGGSAGNAANSTSSALVPATSSARATGTVSFTPVTTASTSSATRKPAYISTATTYATLFIDGATPGQRQACTATAACTFNWTSTGGQHTFAVETDNSTALSGGGSVLSEGSQTYTLEAGNNGQLSTIVLDGVIGNIIFESEVTGLSGCYPIPGTGSDNCIQGTYGLADASGTLITDANYDPNGIILNQIFTEPWIITPSDLTIADRGPILSPIVPDQFGNDDTFNFACYENSNGMFTAAALGLTVNEYPNDPITQNPYISTTDLQFYNITVPATPQIVNFPQYQCTNGQISAVGPSSGSVTVNSKH